MYAVVLFLHSWLRWAALVGGAGATLAAWRATGATRAHAADRWGLALMVALDLQLLLGLWLYLVLSPYTAGARTNVDVMLRDPTLRFWNVEHLVAMLGAVVLGHAGRVLARKAPGFHAKRTRLLVCFGLATLLMIVATPWPIVEWGRPWFRLTF